MSDEDIRPKKSRLSRITNRDGIVFGAGMVFGAAALYAGYRFDPVPATVRLTLDEIQHLRDNPAIPLLSKGFKGTIAIVQKTPAA